MKKTALFILFVAFAFIANAQKSKIAGSWLMIKAETEGEIQEPYFITDFKENGKMEVMGMDAGSWKYNKSSNSIVMESELDKDFNGEGKILKLTKKELVVSKDGARLTYKKVDVDEMMENNKKSNFPGTWKIEGPENPEAISVLKLELPDSFVLVETDYGSTSTTRGSWMFNQKEETVIFIGFSHLLRGKNLITTLTADKFVLDNNGNIITAIKENTELNKIERLTFTEEDFFDENGDYKYYDDEQKLPWQDPYEMIIELVNVHHLVYIYSTLINGTETLTSKTLTADVKADEEGQTLSIDFIFYGYDNYNLPEDTELPPNNYNLSGYSNILYPLKDNPFRVLGTEHITTPAGTFDCTIVEALGDFEVKKKLWMINDKPGIYAKIIQEKENYIGDLEYFIYELAEIK